MIDPFYDWAILKNAISQNAHEPTTDGPSDWGFWLGAIGMVVIFWSFWGIMFYRYAKDDDPNTLVIVNDFSTVEGARTFATDPSLPDRHATGRRRWRTASVDLR